MIDIKAIKAAAEAATPQPWIDPGEGNMPFICMMTPATVIALCDEVERLRSTINEFHHAIKDAGWHPGRTDDLLTDIIRAKGDEIERLRADAARYQWLKRERVKENYEGELGIEFECGFDRYNDIDAAIDAAMEAK